MQGQKRLLRRQYMTWRCGLSIAEWQYRSRLLGDRLVSHPAVETAKTILAYQSHRQEPDLSTVWGRSERVMAERIWGLPRCIKGHPSDPKPTQLAWHEWQPGQPLEPGTYGLREPDPAWPTIQPEQVDLILVPMVAGDRQGYRLGYGGGFYDRLFSAPQWQAIPKVGLIFDELLVESLPHEPWDQPLDAICTDQQWVEVSGRSFSAPR